jgi:hypothetical protein
MSTILERIEVPKPNRKPQVITLEHNAEHYNKPYLVRLQRESLLIRGQSYSGYHTWKNYETRSEAQLDFWAEVSWQQSLV